MKGHVQLRFGRRVLGKWVDAPDQDQLVPADIRGHFAIHRRALNDHGPGWRAELGEKGWTVTHVPTGFALFRVRTKAIALQAVKFLEELRGDWSSPDPKAVKRTLSKRAMRSLLATRKRLEAA